MKESKDTFCEGILSRLKSVLPLNLEKIALHEPRFDGNEWRYVKDCLDTSMVSTVGEYVGKFERMLAEYTGVRYAVATVNGTSALHICLLLAGVQRGDEVIVPDLTFIGTTNAIAYCGAIPHFADSEERTLGMDAAKLNKYLGETTKLKNGICVNSKTGRRIVVVVPMHTFGHPVDIDALSEVAEKFRLTIVEDAAEALGSQYKGKHTGNWGKLACLSFNGNKTITTGGGGAILTNDLDLAKLAKHITTTARQPDRWNFLHDQIGYNYRLPNINAALGCAQMERIDGFIKNKRKLAEKYAEAFQSVPGIRFFREPSFARSNYWLNALLLDRDKASELEKLLELTNGAGIMTRPAWRLMHRLPMFIECPKMDTTCAEDIEARLINIPSSSFLVGG